MSTKKISSSQRHRSFSASAEAEDAPNEPVTFDVAGETFEAKPEIQGIVLMDFLEASDGGGVGSIVAFKNFIKDSMEEDEYTRFDKHLRTAKENVGVAKIAEIVAYLVEEYTSRPTTASAQ
jgi:hypothetical protein